MNSNRNLYFKKNRRGFYEKYGFQDGKKGMILKL
jgi:hypothetical protein